MEGKPRKEHQSRSADRQRAGTRTACAFRKGSWRRQNIFQDYSFSSQASLLDSRDYAHVLTLFTGVSRVGFWALFLRDFLLCNSQQSAWSTHLAQFVKCCSLTPHSVTSLCSPRPFVQLTLSLGGQNQTSHMSATRYRLCLLPEMMAIMMVIIGPYKHRVFG